ncbi:MAG: hypothetical protein QM760_11770 [Nibricoccus sp.]
MIRSFGALALTLLLALAPARAETVAEQQAKFAAAEGIGLAQVALTGEVLSTDVAKRELIMTDALGNRTALKVDESVLEFEKTAKGDSVKVVYFITGKAELRQPSLEEKKAPFTVLETSDLPKNPFKTNLKTYRMVTTIDSIDASTGTVTIKGIQGNSAPVKLKDKKAASMYSTGDTVVITYTEPLVASLEKIAPAKK